MTGTGAAAAAILGRINTALDQLAGSGGSTWPPARASYLRALDEADADDHPTGPQEGSDR